MPGNVTQNRRALTLLELLVVSVIVSALTALLIPALTLSRARSNLMKCASNLQQIGQAMQMYADSHLGCLFPGPIANSATQVLGGGMGADPQHITDFVVPPAYEPPVPPGAPGVMDAQGNMVYYITWPGMVLGAWTGAPPSLYADPTAKPPIVRSDPPTLLAFTKLATPQVMLCPADDPAPYAYHSYFVNAEMSYRGMKVGNRPPTGQSSATVIVMGEKMTGQCNYYMGYADCRYGNVDFTRHGSKWGSNYLYLDMHVDNQVGIPSFAAMDPWGGYPPYPGRACPAPP